MKKISIICMLCTMLISCANNSENNEQPVEQDVVTVEEESIEDEYDTEDWSETIMDLTPEGYVLFKTYKGDLNNDEHEDMVAVFNAVDSNDEMINRAVMLVTTNADGKMKVAAFNKNAALCGECGGVMGDPLADVVIKNGYFTIEHFGGSRTKWTNDPTFKYNKEDGKWYLHKHSKQFHDGLDPENGSSSSILSTKDFGVVDFEEFNITGE